MTKQIEDLPIMKAFPAGTPGKYICRVREEGRTVVIYTTPEKKKADTAKKMAEKWIVARTKQLTKIAERKRELNFDLAERLMVKYRRIAKLKQERDSLGATMKGLEGDIQAEVKEAAAPTVALVFNWTDNETKAKAEAKGGKPSGKSPAGVRKTAKQKAKR